MQSLEKYVFTEGYEIYKSKVIPLNIYETVKRIFDIILSIIALFILSSIFLITSVLVKLDGGPVIFKQTRIGLNGNPFIMYKFRSMKVNATECLHLIRHLNDMDGPVFKINDDPRITFVGKFIRKFSIDELPQIINVLKGEMTIVGPRPALPLEVAQYNEYQSQRLIVKQGLTCYWQCSGRNNISFDKWIDLDIKYIKERSMLADLKIIFKTIPAVLTANGAR